MKRTILCLALAGKLGIWAERRYFLTPPVEAGSSEKPLLGEHSGEPTAPSPPVMDPIHSRRERLFNILGSGLLDNGLLDKIMARKSPRSMPVTLCEPGQRSFLKI